MPSPSAPSTLLLRLFPGMNRNIALLILALAFGQSTLVMLIATSTLAAVYIVDDKSLAFLPTALQFFGMFVATIPAAYIMKLIGRRWGTSIGALAGIVAGGLSCYAVLIGSFWLLCVGGFLFGLHSIVINQMRFAAVEAATPGYQANAISYVMIGGVIAAVMGPMLATAAKDWLSPVSFAGVYLAVMLLMIAALIIVQFTNIPAPKPEGRADDVRSLPDLVLRPRFLVAMVSAMVGYGVMNFMMVPTPLAMAACGFDPSDSNAVVSMHVLGMFAPSFFTGRLITRFGVERIILVGAGLLLAAAAIALSGIGFGHFSVALIALGIGWNFTFIGGTAMLAQEYRPQERAKAQSVNDLVVFSLVSVSSMTAGQVLEAGGWVSVVLTAIPVTGLIFLALFVGRLVKKPEHSAAGS